MSPKSFVRAGVCCVLTCTASGSITIPTVPIGNPGNAPDSTGYGSVSYAYNIGAHEVTIGQYAAFLNSVAATDTFGLYNGNMSDPVSGITRSGSPGTYSYAIVAGRGDHPMNFVSFWDATRFANWMHNGQPTGLQNAATTEDGAYTLTTAAINNNTVTRNPGWQWAVTSEDEWYKAAYHQPASQGGDVDDYWRYGISSNTINTTQANYDGVIGDTTPVGSYAPNFYGVYDMSANLLEWNEAIFSDTNRGTRGGSYLGSGMGTLQAQNRGSNNAHFFEVNILGFRVVHVPGPSAVAVLAMGGIGVLRRRQ